MVYTADHPPVPDSAELRARIPGWGVDLDPADRPAVPRLRPDPAGTGAHWELPERQPEKWPRERSIEHAMLTPVFGTSTPPRGLSGVIRRYAYGFSEGRAAHWLLLLGADRINAVEGHLESFLTTRPDNPFTQTGIRSEFTHHGWKSRVGTTRVDKSHTWMDPLIVGGPWVLTAVVLAKATRSLANRLPKTRGRAGHRISRR
ncbi:hypothetical protein [Mycolicibacterium confluentis]|uniref:Uncharacterized protein n=1 Tax=Mycolicibacterium confluentis TaxID=28047 RepID=A0A7I7Y3S3_9MYCO|nr:hypothetical protein [Mycolicibacterium confluentis]MCV7322775.1 hypothetical protein [Mycolicibacterium confluentis]ORV29700.1 hypothetical protein AWB99_16085 [Mycolicibacterium confluentis]BBZ36317.1 hypothetical protein MCNF_49220 [Mycolicibacterium confluentis]